MNADTIRELSAALQSGAGRVRVTATREFGIGSVETLWVVCGARVYRVGIIAPEKHADVNPFEMLYLEAALREEIEARGWWWQVQSYDGVQWLAHVSPIRDEPGGRVSTEGPAHALALALLDALKATDKPATSQVVR